MPSENKPAIAQGQKSKPEPAIVVSHVSMLFKRAKDEATSVKELLVRAVRGQNHYEMFKALDNINLTIQKGEVVGIIGTNGSGKSTLLKIISGALIPTRGKVLVDRKSVQLLTLGTGFMEEKVRNYSSGMVSRLGFAIATIRDTPEILILDEVLSVGDMFFRQKSEARIREMIHGGSTVLMVSHSTSVIQANCSRAVWIEKGRLRADGNPKEVCRAYETLKEM